jgi:hypothetical protein
MDLAAAIENRHCIRRYDGRPVAADAIQQVILAGRNAVPLRPEIDVRWYVVWDGSALGARLGQIERGCTEGTPIDQEIPVTSSPHYILAVSEERPGFAENLGFRMEQLILMAASLGLGTCWVGCLPRTHDFKPTITERLHEFVPDLGSRERIAALTPLGYADESLPARMARQLSRWSVVEQQEQLPLHALFFQDIWGVPWVSLPNQAGLKRCFERTLHMPWWSGPPSWRFIVDDHHVIATVPAGPEAGPALYPRLIAGIAMCHLYLAAQSERLLPSLDSSGRLVPTWHTPNEDGRAWMQIRYGVPDSYQILGVLNLTGR